jgi:hypothetical protein
MDWGKWIDGLLRDIGLAVIPVLTAALSLVTDDPGAPWWLPGVATAVLVSLKRLSNWLKHRNHPTPT